MKINFDKSKLTEVAKEFGLKFVILHGSFAIGSPHKESDLDIAVLGFREIDFDRQIKLFSALSEVFKLPPQTDLDLKFLQKVDPLFRYEVTRAGKLLFGNSTDYEEFKAFAVRAYEDARPLLDLEQLLAQKFQTHLNRHYAQ